MEFTSINELNRLRDLGENAPWSTSGPYQAGLNSGVLTPQVLAAAQARARVERALAFHAAIDVLGRSFKRLLRGPGVGMNGRHS